MKPFVAVIAFFDGDEFVHVAGGDRGDGKPDFFFRAFAAWIALCRQPRGMPNMSDRREVRRLGIGIINRQVKLSSERMSSSKTRHVAVVHRPFGDDADLDAIAERIVAVGRIGVRLMPWDQIRIGTPIGFLAIKAF